MSKRDREITKIIHRTGIVTPDFIVDEVFRDNRFLYLVVSKQTRKMEEFEEFPHPPRLFRPVECYDDVEDRFIFFPQRPEEYGSDEKLDEEIFKFLNFWCDYQKEFKVLDVAYVKLTWVSDWLFTVPFRRALGEFGTGKSRWAECILALSRYGFKQGATATAAGVYRKSDRYRGVQGFDENDYGGNTKISGAIQLVLNAAYKKSSGFVSRQIKSGDDFIDRSLVCYGPKIIAARNTFADIATESRCITHRSYKSNKAPMEITEEFYVIAQELRNKLLMWRINHIEKLSLEIKRFETALIAEKIEPRLIEVSKPLTRFMSSDAQLMTLCEVVGHANDLIKSEKFFTPQATVLRAVSKIIEVRQAPVVGDIAAEINELEGRMRWQKANPKWVASVLRGMRLVAHQKYVPAKGSNPVTLIVEGRYVKSLIDRMKEYEVPVPKILVEQYDRQIREMSR